MVEKILSNTKVKKIARNIETYLVENNQFLYNNVFLKMKCWGKSVIEESYCENIEKDIEMSKDVYWQFNPSRELNNPLVSVIVPNYNHAQYLEKRLESIYNQTYKNIEVILLDDCSTDNSRNILNLYKDKYSKITRTCFNEANGKNVFKQWEKGLSLANGDYIWIAESDDWCDLEFLEKLIPTFQDETVLLSFCRTDFIQDGIKIYDTESYLGDTSLNWNESFFITAYNLTREAFAIKNVIPNVSSTVFRKKLNFSDELRNVWNGMRLCGDWALYLDTIKGGTVAFVHDVTNYYRIHKASTSLNIQKETAYYNEHERIAKFIASNYNVPDDVYHTMLNNLKVHYLSYNSGTDASDVEQWFSIKEIKKYKNRRKPNIMMCVFSLQSGGGETFPIILANEMKHQGYAVTLCNFNLDKFEIGIKNMIRKDIAYIDLSKNNRLNYIINQFGLDIIHSQHGSVDEIITHFVDKKDCCSHVISLHGMYEAIDKIYLDPLLEKVKKSCSAFVYAADKNLIPFKEHDWDVSEFYKIGNGLLYTETEPVLRSELGISEAAFLICVVTRAIPSKGWEKAIKAVTEARKNSDKDIQLILIGDGEVYDKLKNKTPKFVHLLGFKSNIRSYFAASDIGLLPSEFKGESFPLVIIDCLFTVTPMIVTDIGESKNQIVSSDGEAAGIVIPMNNGVFEVDDLSEAIVELCSNTDKYNKLKNNVKNVRKKFFIDEVTKKYLNVYSNVMNEKWR